MRGDMESTHHGHSWFGFSKDKPIFMEHLNSLVQSFPTGLWDPTGGPPNCLHEFHVTLMAVKLLK